MRDFGPGADDGRQPLEAHALVDGVLHLLDVGGHALPGPPVDDDGVFGAEPSGRAGRVHGGVAAAVDHHATSENGWLALLGVMQQRDGVEDARRVSGGDVGVLGPLGAHGEERGIEALVPHGRLEVVDRPPADDLDAQGANALDLALHDVTRQAVGGDAVAHHAPRQGRRLVQDDLVPEEPQVVGGREAARPGADDEHPPPRGRSRRVGRPALAECAVAQEPLHGVDPHRLVHGGPVAGRLTGVEAGSSHHGG